MQREAHHELDVKTHRVITMLNRQEMDFLDTVGKDALFSTGHKLSYNDILRVLIDCAMQMGISGSGIDSSETLRKVILQRCGNTKLGQ